MIFEPIEKEGQGDTQFGTLKAQIRAFSAKPVQLESRSHSVDAQSVFKGERRAFAGKAALAERSADGVSRVLAPNEIARGYACWCFIVEQHREL